MKKLLALVLGDKLGETFIGSGLVLGEVWVKRFLGKKMGEKNLDSFIG